MIAAFASTPALGAPAVGPRDRSRGDPRIYALLVEQGLGDFSRGSTLTRLCSIEPVRVVGGYTLYWLQKLTQAAVEVHGFASILVISHTGDLLGTYDSSMGDHPRCVGQNSLTRTLDGDTSKQFVQRTRFSGRGLPPMLGGGGGLFTPNARYLGRRHVDGVDLPQTTNPQ